MINDLIAGGALEWRPAEFANQRRRTKRLFVGRCRWPVVT